MRKPVAYLEKCVTKVRKGLRLFLLSYVSPMIMQLAKGLVWPKIAAQLFLKLFPSCTLRIFFKNIVLDICNCITA